MSRASAVLLLFAVTGCKPEEPPPWIDDTRIDGGSDLNDPESSGTRMCAHESSVYVLWVDDRVASGRRDLWLNRSGDLGQTWLEAPARINRGDGLVDSPELTCSADGVFVVWSDDRDGTLGRGNIYFSHSIDGTEFPEEDRLISGDEEGFTEELSPRISLFGDRVAVTWSSDSYGSYDIFVSVSDDLGQSWQIPQRIEADQPGSGWSGRPQVALGERDEVWVTWEDTRNNEGDIYFAYSDTGGRNFTNGEARLDLGDDVGASDSFAPQLCTDNREDLLVVWQDLRNGDAETGEGTDILFNTSSDGGRTWLDEAVRLDSGTPGAFDSEKPRCYSRGYGTFDVVWSDGRNSAMDIYHRTIQDGIPGEEEERIDTGTGAGSSDALDPQLAGGPNGPVVAWRGDQLALEIDPDSLNSDLYYNYVDASGGFLESELRIDAWPDGLTEREDLNIAVIGGTMHVAWTDSRNVNKDIYVRTLSLGDEAVPPPTTTR